MSQFWPLLAQFGLILRLVAPDGTVQKWPGTGGTFHDLGTFLAMYAT